MSSQYSAGLPSTFDPFKTHPFTNISRAPPPMPAPNPYPRPVRTYQPPGAQARPPAPTAPSSLPTSQTPVHSPQPQRASPQTATATRMHVFEPFKYERASPDLQDVLAKKGANSPGRRPSNTARDDAKQKKTK
ncbi:uncharacterized protein FOMMEDRAFT_132373 [Fomitiporia mediterranea MF3/22]|uniref:uncharacterized protein n=1 Tax=Fomitiporia mediterranea (strain MF3/22) TaxID=694068 RepID=UPI0004407A49|nr:uncharacterized protein FOMMEDRAFT_132373 [Fomitiporia mediterranea MF3/22]EJD05950.1 hypothetical protein FOMMEDRAFT_132373 [Fomitiporia mediterranea MF3/22]